LRKKQLKALRSNSKFAVNGGGVYEKRNCPAPRVFSFVKSKILIGSLKIEAILGDAQSADERGWNKSRV